MTKPACTEQEASEIKVGLLQLTPLDVYNAMMLLKTHQQTAIIDMIRREQAEVAHRASFDEQAKEEAKRRKDYEMRRNSAAGNLNNDNPFVGVSIPHPATINVSKLKEFMETSQLEGKQQQALIDYERVMGEIAKKQMSDKK